MFLFYVFFDINPEAAVSFDHDKQNLEVGMLVKTVSLPKYRIHLKKYNHVANISLILNSGSFNIPIVYCI